MDESVLDKRKFLSPENETKAQMHSTDRNLSRDKRIFLETSDKGQNENLWNETEVALKEPEIFVIGEIEGGFGLGTGVCCRWQFDYSAMWVPLDGHMNGQTQVDYPSDGDSVVWSHPLDAHFLCKGLQGWPRLLIQVWSLDEVGRLHLAGYGFVHIPNVSGSFELNVATWRPVGTLKEEISTLFLDSTPMLRDINVLYRKAWSHRNRITTQTSGCVRIRLDVMFRHFSEANIDE